MINETGTMTGGGGKPKGGRMCIGNAAPKARSQTETSEELVTFEEEFQTSKQVWSFMAAARLSLYGTKVLKVCPPM